MNYVEENQRKGKDPWSFRHTGIYHHHTVDFDFFIILHPSNNSVLETRLFQLLGANQATNTEKSRLAAICKSPYRIHSLVISSFFENWRWYLRKLGDDFQEVVCTSSPSNASENKADSGKNDSAMVVKPEAAEARDSFMRVKSLRNTNDLILFAKACCSSDLELVQKLKLSTLMPCEDDSVFQSQETILNGHVESLKVLEGRTRNAIDLVCGT